MPNYMFVHPLLGITTVGLILAAFAMKTGERKYWTLHYATGLLAAAAGTWAFSAAILAVARRWLDSGGHPNLPFIASVHLGLATLGLLALTIQGIYSRG